MADVDEQGRPEPPLAAGEVATLQGFLDYQRATLEWKTRGLDGTGLAATVGSSAMTLGGLLKHLASVEDYWCSVRLHERDPHPEWAEADFRADPDWEWRSAADDPPEQLRRQWQQAVERSRHDVALALQRGGLDQLGTPWRGDDRRPSLRWILCHLVEEYARHNGHADLLRESVDGQTGE
ncbi:DinB family protein [Ornithinicoccus halotolerans]|uniref:DinB family protein n=1 Tax=Ornithinicoccus halotolerans TaxID=1748220 RepID=UPI0012971C94|nr:DinB family protein [Ornithinicoccus halotolerans]